MVHSSIKNYYTQKYLAQMEKENQPGQRQSQCGTTGFEELVSVITDYLVNTWLLINRNLNMYKKIFMS